MRTLVKLKSTIAKLLPGWAQGACLAKWYHNGTRSNGLTIEEVWERVEKK